MNDSRVLCLLASFVLLAFSFLHAEIKEMQDSFYVDQQALIAVERGQLATESALNDVLAQLHDNDVCLTGISHLLPKYDLKHEETGQ